MAQVFLQEVSIGNWQAAQDKGTVWGSGACSFSTSVLRASAAINGFSVGYESKDDHHLSVLGANILEVQPSGVEVTVNATLTLSDKNRENVLTYHTMSVLVIAWCE